MAVRAGLRIVGEVRAAFGVDKGVSPDPGCKAQQHSQRDAGGPNASARIHSIANNVATRSPRVGPRTGLDGELSSVSIT